MSESTPNDDALARQARAHLESLRTAGIDWVGTEPPLKVPPASTLHDASMHFAVPEPTPEPTGSLFGDPDEPEDTLTPEDRRIGLTTLAATVRPCTRCPELASTRTQTVFGVGPIRPEICLVGEAPGADEDRIGEPFVGAAGQMLNRILLACGIQRNEVYICNTLKCRPPGNRAPKPIEAENCFGYFEEQIRLVRPRYIVALGLTAAHNMLKVSTPLVRLRGKFHEYQGIPLMVTYHPSYLLPHRSPEKKRDVWEDMKMLLTKMGKPIPTPKAPPAGG